MTMNTQISHGATSFFGGYALDFDEIYALQAQEGLRGWLNWHLRASMLMRYERTFRWLQPMQGRTVLDIGCGAGRYTVQCLDLGASRITGIDLNREMISLAQRAVSDWLTEPSGVGCMADSVASFVQADFIEYSFSHHYDYAIAMGVMDYVGDVERFLRKIRQVVNRRAVLSFPVRESIWTPQRKARYMLRGCPVFFYSRRQLVSLIKSLHFQRYHIERIGRDYFVAVDV